MRPLNKRSWPRKKINVAAEQEKLAAAEKLIAVHIADDARAKKLQNFQLIQACTHSHTRRHMPPPTPSHACAADPYTHTRVPNHRRAHTRMQTRTYTRALTYTRTRVQTQTNAHAHAHARARVPIRARTHTHTLISAHAHTHVHTKCAHTIERMCNTHRTRRRDWKRKLEAP